MNPTLPTQHGVSSVTAGRRYSVFHRFASRMASWLGRPWAFVLSVTFVAGWAVAGRRFHYSDSWQIVINTVTGIVTFLMLFLFQSTQKREVTSLNLKLSELIRGMDGARNELLRAEHLADEDIERFGDVFRRLGRKTQLRHISAPTTTAGERVC